MSFETRNKGNLILIIGMTGTGKSQFNEKTFLNGNGPVMVYDVQDEYSNLKEDNSGKIARCKVNPTEIDINGFIKLSGIRVNTNIIYEEATAFFQFRANGEMMKRLISKRHGNNNYIFIFHSIKRVPKDLFELTNYIVLFKTNDLITDVERKRPELIAPFKALKASRNKHDFKLIKF